MRKEWKEPIVRDLAVSETKTNECPYKKGVGDAVTYEIFGPEKCCPCEFYAACNKAHKYTGPCNS